jgi:hypothetical protein
MEKNLSDNYQAQMQSILPKTNFQSKIVNWKFLAHWANNIVSKIVYFIKHSNHVVPRCDDLYYEHYHQFKFLIANYWFWFSLFQLISYYYFLPSYYSDGN